MGLRGSIITVAVSTCPASGPRPAARAGAGRRREPGPAQPLRGLARLQKLTPKRREHLHEQILERALCCSVAQASIEEIERLNILQATLLAMQRAVAGLRLRPTLVLVDGNRLPALDLPAQAVVQGDDRVAAIAAASIVAKVQRDRLCDAWHAQYPDYGFDRHKGYGTAAHLQALQRCGPTPLHRRSFAPVAALLVAANPA